MNTEEIIISAIKLTPVERFEIIDSVLRSLNHPDPEIDELWIEEAKLRLQTYRAGLIEGIPAENIFGGFSSL